MHRLFADVSAGHGIAHKACELMAIKKKGVAERGGNSLAPACADKRKCPRYLRYQRGTLPVKRALRLHSYNPLHSLQNGNLRTAPVPLRFPIVAAFAKRNGKIPVIVIVLRVADCQARSSQTDLRRREFGAIPTFPRGGAGATDLEASGELQFRIPRAN